MFYSSRRAGRTPRLQWTVSASRSMSSSATSSRDTRRGKTCTAIGTCRLTRRAGLMWARSQSHSRASQRTWPSSISKDWRMSSWRKPVNLGAPDDHVKAWKMYNARAIRCFDRHRTSYSTVDPTAVSRNRGLSVLLYAAMRFTITVFLKRSRDAKVERVQYLSFSERRRSAVGPAGGTHAGPAQGSRYCLSGGVIMLLYSTGPESNPSIVPVCIPELISSAPRHSRNILCAQVFGELSLGSFRLRYALE